MTVARNTAANQSKAKASRFALAAPVAAFFARLGKRTKPAAEAKPVHGYATRADWGRDFGGSSGFADSIRGF